MKTNSFAVELWMARKSKRLTQEEACFMIGASEPATISRWENGKEIPSMKMVDTIIEIYGDPFLGYVYLQQCTSIGQKVLPPIERRDLGNSVLMLQKEHTDINRIKDVMIDIVCDGQIEASEQDQWCNALKEIQELASACIGLALTTKEKTPLQDSRLGRVFA
ncbi:MAG: helix-turn-helix domain-containing protein [Cellulosilyticaceae bacterium]